ncbi:helix-turn-helix domain-containing protein [Endozoicomonas euniceicola]|uniref:Helix-turn-helix domain-containing protein n=1 Tax=Endozoicomonas euniceicola TaxID=1234143 RepID=A0ABY6GTY7_9GAMM|nr:helix-turn-helix domain-containing protein [Endozoicomonas euniceicola]UYM16220.1 helix-turn-helix domain-containing protein [Endozoicomonas euniceicola]
MLKKTTKSNDMSPGSLIRNFRIKRGVSLDEMAQFLYCTKSELSLIENDKKSISRMKRLLWSTLIPEWTPNMLSPVQQSSPDHE